MAVTGACRFDVFLLDSLFVVITGEFGLWRMELVKSKVLQRPNIAIMALDDVGSFFPNISIWLQKLVTLSISTAQAECTFLTVDRTLTAIRSKMNYDLKH